MTRAGVVSDEFWRVVAPLMPVDEGRPGRRFRDHRMILEGIVWRFRAGSPWRDLPKDFGPWQTVWKRHRRWSFDGTYEAMFAATKAAFGTGSAEVPAEMQRLLSADATSVRAHQHAAGAPAAHLTGG